MNQKQLNKIKEPRYFVDKRVGCISVLDRTKIDTEHAGLSSESEGVVKYWDGYQKMKTCPTCDHESFNGWAVKDEYVSEAENLCKELNEKNKS